MEERKKRERVERLMIDKRRGENKRTMDGDAKRR